MKLTAFREFAVFVCLASAAASKVITQPCEPDTSHPASCKIDGPNITTLRAPNDFGSIMDEESQKLAVQKETELLKPLDRLRRQRRSDDNDVEDHLRNNIERYHSSSLKRNAEWIKEANAINDAQSFEHNQFQNIDFSDEEEVDEIDSNEDDTTKPADPTAEPHTTDPNETTTVDTGTDTIMTLGYPDFNNKTSAESLSKMNFWKQYHKVPRWSSKKYDEYRKPKRDEKNENDDKIIH